MGSRYQLVHFCWRSALLEVNFIPSGSYSSTTVRGSAVGANLAKGLERLISLTWVKNTLNQRKLCAIRVLFRGDRN